LLDGGEVKVHGFLCPGHASIILGSDAFRPIVEDYAMPCVVAGFEAEQMLAGMARLTEMVADGLPGLDNVYPQVVKPEGNRVAQAIIEKVFEPVPAKWRALGEIPGSGLRVRDSYAEFDAVRRFGLVAGDAPEPAGCRCGEVITGRCTPADCKLFVRRCTPLSPVGPCMVSSEGSCAAWFKYGRAEKVMA
jgi:hydrogenase expression/formation protein HypD